MLQQDYDAGLLPSGRVGHPEAPCQEESLRRGADGSHFEVAPVFTGDALFHFSQHGVKQVDQRFGQGGSEAAIVESVVIGQRT